MICYIDSTGKIYGGTYGKTIDDLRGITHLPSGSTYAILVDDTQYPDIQTNMGEYTLSNVVASDVFYVPTAIGTPTFTPIPDATKLANAQNAKITSLQQKRDAAIVGGFTSSALGTAHTYLSDKDSMVLLNGEYSFVMGADYDGKLIDWYTKEAGYQYHTAQQFRNMYLDGRNFVQTQKLKLQTKANQIQHCTTISQVDSIDWINPNPPSVPTGLTGTPGTGQATLSWTANTDVTMIVGGGYNVYQDGVKVNTSLVTSATYIATGLTSGTSYQFAVSAVDTDGLESAKSANVTVTSN